MPTTLERIPTKKLLAEKGEWWMTFGMARGLILKSKPDEVLFRISDAADPVWIHRNALLEPIIGMGAFQCLGIQRYPYTVISVSANGKRLNLQADFCKRVYFKKTENEWQFIQDPKGAIVTALLRKDGTWWAKDQGLFVLGTRELNLGGGR